MAEKPKCYRCGSDWVELFWWPMLCKRLLCRECADWLDRELDG